MMALHGLIQINGLTIGGWDAVRVLTGSDGVHEYDCGLSEGDGLVQARIKHREADGAAILASKVLALRPKDWPVQDRQDDQGVGPAPAAVPDGQPEGCLTPRGTRRGN